MEPYTQLWNKWREATYTQDQFENHMFKMQKRFKNYKFNIFKLNQVRKQNIQNLSDGNQNSACIF